MKSEPSWDLYRSFAAVLQEGSLSGAARMLGMTQPSIARHIETLEQSVGGGLFLRSPRGLSPTDRALSLRPYAEALVATSAALLRVASTREEDVSGSIRLSASEIVAVEHLPPILAAMRLRHPNLAIELLANDAVDDLLLRQADIAVRMVEPTQRALLARRIGSLELGFYAHRDYLARNAIPLSIDELRTHNLIGTDSENPFVRRMMQSLGGMSRSDFAFRSDSTIAQLAAIRAGFGIGICQSVIARRDHNLRRVLPDAVSLQLPLWVVMHEDLRGNARCRAMFDTLAEGLRPLVEPA